MLKLNRKFRSVKDSVFISLEVEVRHKCVVEAESAAVIKTVCKRFEEEWKERAILFHKFLATVSENPSSEHRNKF